jgi:hypothetical protein
MKDSDQSTLFEIEPKWKETWDDELLEFDQKDISSYDSIRVHFRNDEDRRSFLLMLGENPARKRSIWWPQMEILSQSQRDVEPVKVKANRYPIYVISKGRSEKCLTSRELKKLGIDHHVVVESQEYDAYANTVDADNILVLPFSNLGQGSIPARNWVWEHALSTGSARHWILDDNIQGYYRLNQNQKVKVTDDNPFSAVEDFTEKFSNVLISGHNYEFFADRRSAAPPFYLNTRVYSSILIQNDAPFRWRGRYNEDTDLCLRILKAGFCTILFNAILAKKLPTMTMKGGNTDELYQDDGRLQMANSLKEQHSDVVTVTKRWGRWQHCVNYAPFKRNRLIRVEK